MTMNELTAGIHDYLDRTRGEDNDAKRVIAIVLLTGLKCIAQQDDSKDITEDIPRWIIKIFSLLKVSTESPFPYLRKIFLLYTGYNHVPALTQNTPSSWRLRRALIESVVRVIGDVAGLGTRGVVKARLYSLENVILNLLQQFGGLVFAAGHMSTFEFFDVRTDSMKLGQVGFDSAGDEYNDGLVMRLFTNTESVTFMGKLVDQEDFRVELVSLQGDYLAIQKMVREAIDLFPKVRARYERRVKKYDRLKSEADAKKEIHHHDL